MIDYLPVSEPKYKYFNARNSNYLGGPLSVLGNALEIVCTRAIEPSKLQTPPVKVKVSGVS